MTTPDAHREDPDALGPEAHRPDPDALGPEAHRPDPDAPGQEAPPGVFTPVLLTASAGSGKTYTLSSRLVALLACGAPPDSILASTFTRKAAGEILERVLLRLARGALDEGEAAELAGSLPPGVPPERATREGFEALLSETVRSLHRLQVQTLDAFVNRAVRVFALELGLPSSWEVGEDPRTDRLRSRAVEAVLREEVGRGGAGDSGPLAELVRRVQMGSASRAVHQRLLGVVTEVHAAWRERDPSVPRPWGFEGGLGGWGEPLAPDALAAAWEGLARQVAAAAEAAADDGASNQLLAATGRVETALRAGNPSAFLGETLWKNALDPEADPPRFNRKPIPPPILDAFREVADVLPALEGPRWQRRMEALGEFLPHYDAQLEALRREAGLFGFDDLVDRLASAEALGRTTELYYRLDGRIRHLLLDEFQDTSVRQWAALEPLADEVLAGGEDPRAFFVVADPKQSIYGWRGGEPRLLDHLRARYAPHEGVLSRSWRSSPVVMDFVNRVFLDLASNPVFERPEDAEVAARWAEGFTRHEAARTGLPGRVVVRSTPRDEEDSKAQVARRRLVSCADEVAWLHRVAPGLSLGILTRTNRTASALMALLRERGIEASEEGGVPVADSAPVLGVLAALSMADHPGDLVSAYLVSRSPLGPRLHLADPHDAPAVSRAARRIRARLLADGYGTVVEGLAAGFRPGASPRDRRRLDQLVELAWQWEAGATLRPSDFVRHVRASRREDAGAARVRLMTIHRSKGLEFDAVFLPEPGSFSGGGGRTEALAFRAEPGGPVTRIHAALNRDLAPFFPELDEPRAQAREAELRDALGTLYVAVTRARCGVTLYLDPDGKSVTRAQGWPRLLREARGLQTPGEGVTWHADALDPKGRLLPDRVLFEAGDPAWWEKVPGSMAVPPGGQAPPAGIPPAVPPPAAPPAAPLPTAPPPAAQSPAPLPMAASPRRRLVPRRTPSALEGAGPRPIAELLRPGASGALARGNLVHAWFEALEWLEAERPLTEARLLAWAEEAGAGPVPDAVSLARDFLRWLEAPALRQVLDRSHWPRGTRVQRERPFVVRDGDGLLQGVADRVLLLPEGDASAGGAPGEGDAPTGPRLVVVDWKTDRVDPHASPDEAGALSTRADHYRPQMEAYLRALTRLEGAPPEAAEGRILFVEGGHEIRVRLPPPPEPPVRTG
jgi:ATP-dependent helicase/nuclease subunit A